jgi:hypothetical protein
MMLTLPWCTLADRLKNSSTSPSYLVANPQISLTIKQTRYRQDKPSNIDVRSRRIGVEGGTAQVPPGCVTVKAFALEKSGNLSNVRFYNRHCRRIRFGYDDDSG